MTLPDGRGMRTLFLYKYEYPIDEFVRALKFRGDRVYARVLGTLMAREFLGRALGPPRCIVPMPLHVERFRQRGFNQAREIGRYVASAIGVPVLPDALVRLRPTQEQSGLSDRERRRNVRGVFAIDRPLPSGRIALLDDVVTTGSTAAAAAMALVEGGAEEVELWAVARVERRDRI